jgi:hypothetical protein
VIASQPEWLALLSLRESLGGIMRQSAYYTAMVGVQGGCKREQETEEGE